MNTALTLNNALTMTSREIADLVGSRHDTVKLSIERLVEKGVIAQPPMADAPSKDTMGREIIAKVYLINKRDSYVIVAQLSPEFTGRLVDRWQELEAQQLPAPPSTSIALAAVELRAGLDIAAMLGCPLHLAQIESVKAVKRITGVDLSGFLLVSATQNNIQQEEVMLEPTEIGKVLGISATKVNKGLEAAGLQTKVNGEWVPTEEGEKISTRHSWTKGSKSGYNYKWRLKEIRGLNL